jgi:di/tricarboxylate transporter
MTIDIAIVFLILGMALFLFFSGWVRMDIVALMVLGSLSVTGLVSPAQALSGFSNPAVITVGAMFILSAALYQTGVAKILGRQVLRMAGNSEAGLIVTIMLTSGFLSAFMNNIGVAALMLPVVMDIARSTQRAPSRLLMPLAYGCLLGGLTTLIGTPPNLLISYAMVDNGLDGFNLFDFTPVGLGAMLGGILFIALIGRHLLPKKGAILDAQSKDQMLTASYALQERTFMIRIKPGSELQGKTLAESRFRAALGINVLSVKREGGGTILDPGPDTVMRANDKLFVQGRLEAMQALHGWKILLPEQSGIDTNELLDDHLNTFEARLNPELIATGKTIGERELKKQLGVNILAVNQKGKISPSHFHNIILEPDDRLLLQGPDSQIKTLQEQGLITHVRKVTTKELTDLYQLHQALFIMEISQDSELFDKSTADTQLGAAFGLSVLGILREGQKPYIPNQGEIFRSGDKLLVQGNSADLPLLRGLMDIELLEEDAPGPQSLEEGDIQMAEVVLAPRSLLAGKTLRDINFRKRYGLTVLAIWREGRAYRTNLHNLPLRFGEALLLYGKRDKLELIASENDFILLTDTRQKPMRTDKALTSALIMLGILLPVLLGFIPLAISALIGVSVMVLTGCLKMEEAYRAIEWRSVFLIAGLLPLGAAMKETGAASMMAEGVVELFGRFGPWGIIVGLYMLTSISTLAIPPAALVVVMSPVALQAAESFDVSPYSIMMTIAMAAASSFLSPVSHPANLLVMGPAGYKFSDYLKLGLPLALVVMVVVLVLLPIFWPLGG